MTFRRVLACTVLSATLVPAVHVGAGAERAGGAVSRFVRADGTRLVAPDGSHLLLRGIGLGNWLVPEGYMWKLEHGPESPRQIDRLVRELVGPDEARRFWRDWRERYVTHDDIRFLALIGMNTVRVPFSFRLLTPEDHPEVWLEEGFALLDRLIGWCRQEGLWVVLDMHAAPGGQTGENIDDSWGHPWLFTSEASQARTAEVWRRIAARYRDEPTIAAYELLNEPIPHHAGLEIYNDRLEPLYRRVVEAVRREDPHHLIVLGGAQWNTNFSVFGRPFAPNLAYAFHKYWNETTIASIRPFLDFREKHRVPIWLSESGEDTDEWIAACVRLVEGQNIGWAFWPHKKMDATSSPLSFSRPVHWNEIVAYGTLGDKSFEANRKARPALDRRRAALADLLEQIRFDRCRVNAGYIRALGLDPPR